MKPLDAPIAIIYQPITAIQHKTHSDIMTKTLAKFHLPPLTYPNISTATANYQALSRALRVNLVKETTSKYSAAPKSYVKLVTCINNYNGFYLLVEVGLCQESITL